MILAIGPAPLLGDLLVVPAQAERVVVVVLGQKRLRGEKAQGLLGLGAEAAGFLVALVNTEHHHLQHVIAAHAGAVAARAHVADARVGIEALAAQGASIGDGVLEIEHHVAHDLLEIGVGLILDLAEERQRPFGLLQGPGKERAG